MTGDECLFLLEQPQSGDARTLPLEVRGTLRRLVESMGPHRWHGVTITNLEAMCLAGTSQCVASTQRTTPLTRPSTR